MNAIQYFVFVFLLIVVPNGVSAQHYNQYPWYLKGNSVWAFGNRSAMNFNSGMPVPFQSMINSQMGVASVSDPVTGNLLFYSDGNWVYNRSHGVMPNGHQLLGNRGFVRQGVCIVPFVDQPGKYYLFSLSSFSPGAIPVAHGKLYYSVVDMNLQNKYGDVVDTLKNIFLDSMLSSAMIAIPGNNCDIWLLLHDARFPQFKAYHITAEGISDTPVVSTIGGMFFPTQSTNHSSMAVSPDRSKVVLTFMDGVSPSTGSPFGGAMLASFDPGTGVLSNGIVVEDNQGCATACFSPDNTKLYLTAYEDAPPNLKYMIYQYDVSNYSTPAISASKVFIKQTISSPSDLKLYNDTIYAPTGYLITNPWQGSAFKLYLDRINHPDLAGISCDYQDTAIRVYNGTYVAYTLPNDVAYPIPKDTFTTKRLDTLICMRPGRPFRFGATASIENAPLGYEWQDGNTDKSVLITEPGVYWVMSKSFCYTYVDTFIVRAGIQSPFDLGRDTMICGISGPLLLEAPNVPGMFRWQDGHAGKSYLVKESGVYWLEINDQGCISSDTIKISLLDLTQDIGEDLNFCQNDPIDLIISAKLSEGAEVIWSDGSVTPEIQIADSGIYWVKVSLATCESVDSIRITRDFCDCIFKMPDAFTPNGDGRNDVFRPVIEPGCPINNFQLQIFNRWGERVYSGRDPFTGWDGTWQGAPLESGVYMYQVEFHGGTRSKPITGKGDLMLIR